MDKFIQRILDKTFDVNHEDSIKPAIVPDMIPLSMDQNQENLETMTDPSDLENIEEKPVMTNKFTKKTNLYKPDFTPRLQPKDNSFTAFEEPVIRDTTNIDSTIHVRSQAPKPKTDSAKASLTPRLQPKDNSFTAEEPVIRDAANIDNTIHVRSQAPKPKTDSAKAGLTPRLQPKDNFFTAEEPIFGYEVRNVPDKAEKTLDEKFPIEDKPVAFDDMISPSVSQNHLEKNFPKQITDISPRNDSKPLQNNEFETSPKSANQIQNKHNKSVREDTVVTINIGRVEVHAVQPAVDKKIKPTNIMSLADYIKLRTEDRS